MYPANGAEQIYCQFTGTEMNPFEKGIEDGGPFFYQREPFGYTATENEKINTGQLLTLYGYRIRKKEIC